MSRSITVLLHDLQDGPALRSVMEAVRWMRHAGTDVRIVAEFPGLAGAGVSRVAPLFVVNEYRPVRPSGALQIRGRHRMASRARSVELRATLGRRHDVVWLADPAAATLLPWTGPAHRVVTTRLAAAPGAPTIDGAIRAELRDRSTAWTAGSEAAAADLRSVAGPDAEIVLHPDPVPRRRLFADVTEADASRLDRRRRARAELQRTAGVPPDVPLVLGGGSADHWTTTDTFARLAWELTTLRPDVHLVWARAGASDGMLWPLRHDLRHAGLLERVTIVDDVVPPAERVLAADVAVRTARGPMEPHDAAERVAVGTPVVTYSPAPVSGAGRDGTTTVPWIDVVGLAAAVASHLDTGAAPPRGERCAWDMRFGGQALLELLLGTDR